MKLGIKNKVTIVTGGATGIGFSIACDLAKKGEKLYEKVSLGKNLIKTSYSRIMKCNEELDDKNFYQKIMKIEGLLNKKRIKKDILKDII